MKKLLFCALLAGIAVMTGCQKDHDVVTLKAVMDQDTKAYFGGSTDSHNRLNLPYWNEGDEVFIKGLTFSDSKVLTNPDPENPFTTFATITNVPVSSVYCAIFPSRIAKGMGTPSANGTTASIYYESHQFYKETGNHQQVDMPMGAVTTNETLIFKNLCSILRLNVSNSLTENIDFDVKRLTVQAYNAFLAGPANVTLSNNADPVIDINTPHQALDNVISVYDPDDRSMGTIYHSVANNHPTSKSFDVIVPPFSATKLVLEVEMYKHNADGSSTPLGYYEYTIENPASVARNKIIPIDLRVDRYSVFDYAYFEEGPEFNAEIRNFLQNHSGITKIKINHYPGGLDAITDEWAENSTPSGWVELQASNSPHKIYGYVSASDAATLEINSFASSLYAHSNCSTMFKGLTNIINLQWTETVMFGTEDVTDMREMFAGCTHLQILSDFSSFNTTNVTTMAHMFEDCKALTSLTLPFNTQHLRGDGMVGMFKNCEKLQTLNLYSFTTEQITDMSELFYGCSKIASYVPGVSEEGLYINQFVISEGTTLTDMCTGLASSQSQWGRGAIFCTDAVKSTLLSQDENNHYITGIDRVKVHFPLQGENYQGGTDPLKK